MNNIFFIGDTHFGHANILTFKNWDGTPVRPFSSVEEMDETLVENWNRVVQPTDKVYHLGDVAIPRKGLDILSRLNGKKVLIRGNHDIFKLDDYAKHFYDVRGSHKLDKFVLSHIPIHVDSLARWCDGNIHGHLHNNLVPIVLDAYGGHEKPDQRYINVCVERIGYTPIELSQIRRP